MREEGPQPRAVTADCALSSLLPGCSPAVGHGGHGAVDPQDWWSTDQAIQLWLPCGVAEGKGGFGAASLPTLQNNRPAVGERAAAANRVQLCL